MLPVIGNGLFVKKSMTGNEEIIGLIKTTYYETKTDRVHNLHPDNRYSFFTRDGTGAIPNRAGRQNGKQTGTPYVMKRDYLFKAANGGLVMQTKPPWGTLLAIDLHTGQKKWEVPLGYMLNPKLVPGAENWGSLNFGGAIVTAGNLVFVAASMDNHLRAFDSRNGALLWEYLLPAGGQATPMSYRIDGKQYIVIAARGHGKLRTTQGDYVMAFSLP